jgi:hypothetical protein
MFDYKKHILHAPDEALPTPVTTKEQYLYAKVTGGDTSNLPTPVTTEEQYLYALAQSGSSGDSGGGGGSVLTLYCEESGDVYKAYTDENRTKSFASADDAWNAVNTAGVIRLRYWDGEDYDPAISYVNLVEEESGTVTAADASNTVHLYDPDPGILGPGLL